MKITKLRNLNHYANLFANFSLLEANPTGEIPYRRSQPKTLLYIPAMITVY